MINVCNKYVSEFWEKNNIVDCSKIKVENIVYPEYDNDENKKLKEYIKEKLFINKHDTKCITKRNKRSHLSYKNENTKQTFCINKYNRNNKDNPFNRQQIKKATYSNIKS
jgi:hypothetical protein